MADETYRLDPLSGTWVVLSPGRRALSSQARAPGRLPALDGPCPFCPGAESETEPVVLRTPAAGPWRVRVVDNRFPWVHADPVVRSPPRGGDFRPARGVHEVVVEAPEHDVDLCDLPDGRIVEVLAAYRDRLADLERRPGVEHVSLFRNRGVRAGSSQPHPHGQILAATAPSPTVERRFELAREHHRAHGRPLLEGVVARELAEGDRIVEQTEAFVVLCPFAPLEDFATWIAPRASAGSFSACSDAALEDLAGVLGRTLRRRRSVTADSDYNLLLRLPPTRALDDPAAFWLVDVMPRRSGGAGFELASGMVALTVSPEAAADAMRRAG